MNTTVMMSNTTANSNGKQCDCCLNNISDDSDHVLNFPCSHIVCTLCVVTSNMKRGANPACCQVKDCPQKYTSSCQYFNRGIPGNVIENEVAVIDKVCTDSGVLTNVFAYLVPKEIMSLRRVCKLWKEAAKMTTVPLNSYFNVDSVTNYNAMSVMTRALPNLQGLSLSFLGRGHKYSEGEDPNEMWASYYDYISHDIEIISNFGKLRDLTIKCDAPLNGRYPVFFNSFPLLQKLSIDCKFLKWDLEMLAGLPSLKELDCWSNENLTGNISSLRVLKDKLEEVRIYECENVEGNIMDLADFPRLKKLYLKETGVTGNISSLKLLKDTLEKVRINGCPYQRLSNVEGDFMDLADFPHLTMLNLEGTAVTGDIRVIGEDDFPSLKTLYLPKGVYGGMGYEFQHISDGPDIINKVHLLKKQRPALKYHWYGQLSQGSLDWYESFDHYYRPPFTIRLVEAGSRIGYRWGADQLLGRGIPCEVNWVGPEPSRGSSQYAKYINELQVIEKEREEEGRVDLYKGIHQPPTEDEYHRLLEKYDLLLI